MTFFEKLGRLAPWNRSDADPTRPEPTASRLAAPLTASAAPRAPAPKSEPFPRFRANANDHVNPQAIDASARARMKLLEAFTPSQPVGDPSRGQRIRSASRDSYRCASCASTWQAEMGGFAAPSHAGRRPQRSRP